MKNELKKLVEYGSYGPLPKMVKVKWDKLCGTDRNGKMGRIIRNGGSRRCSLLGTSFNEKVNQ